MRRPGSLIIAYVLLAATAYASAATTRPKPQRFESEIAAYEKRDQQAPPPKDPVLFVGSSSFRMWGKQLEADFRPLVAINRGFGGSTLDDVLFYLPRIVVKYKPRAIVVYCGENDIAMNQSPKEVADNFALFVTRCRESLGANLPVFYVAMKPSPSRWHLREKMKEGNGLIRDYARKTSDVTFIDIAPVMLGEDGKPKPELFLKDNLHMNRAGYEAWLKVMRPALKSLESSPQQQPQ